MATDAKYCYISTTTSQSSSASNYQNIPYRMETTTPVVYQGSSIAPLNYMPIAIWSTLPVFKTSVYYNNGTSTITYPTSDSSLLSIVSVDETLDSFVVTSYVEVTFNL